MRRADVVHASLRLARAGLASAAFLAIALVFAPSASRAEVRVALVVGVGNYKNAPHLANPPNDASDMSDGLKRLGFDTEALIDPDRSSLEGAIRNFGRRARTADVALFFYAGHALEYGGRNWLIPATAEIGSEKDLRFEAIDLADITDQLEGGPRLSVLFLDSCRDNPFRARLGEASRGLTRSGLGEVRVAAGALVAFSTAPGTTAEDGVGRNSPFTTALLANIATPGLEVRQMLDRVRRDVRLATRGRQVPWENSSMEGEFFMIPATASPPLSPPVATTAVAPAPSQAAGEAERVFWESVRGSDDPGDLELYLTRYPNGEFADIARRFIARLRTRQAIREALPPAPASQQPASAAPAAPTPVVPPPVVAAPPPASVSTSTALVAPAAPPPQTRPTTSPVVATRPAVAKPRSNPPPPARVISRTPEPPPTYPSAAPWPRAEAYPPPAAPPAPSAPPPLAAPSFLGTSSGGGAGGCSLSHVC